MPAPGLFHCLGIAAIDRLFYCPDPSAAHHRVCVIQHHRLTGGDSPLS